VARTRRAWWFAGIAAAGAFAALIVVSTMRSDPLQSSFSDADLPADLDAYLSEAEAQVPRLRPGAAKGIVWADPATRRRTPVAVVYVHGFSASRLELSPVVERVAERLGANLFFARLTGHGRDGAAMAEGSAAAWMNDVAEAMAIGRRVGERVILVGTSTGGTLAALAAAEPGVGAGLAGVVFVSPNFRPLDRGAWLLDLPLARLWLPLVAGRERGFQPANAAHAAGWTTRYPTVAVLAMAETVRRARGIRFEDVQVPALFVFSRADTVVDAARTETVAARWGGPATVREVRLGPADDPRGHVLAGDALSPARTDEVVDLILAWARGLGTAAEP
jgi:pimeloyl-ACP methyl ester carboxylesterase